MDYPNLLIAVRRSGLKQYEVARAAGLREGRLSVILRRGAATVEERNALSRVLSAAPELLFGAADFVVGRPKRRQIARRR